MCLKSICTIQYIHKSIHRRSPSYTNTPAHKILTLEHLDPEPENLYSGLGLGQLGVFYCIFIHFHLTTYKR